MKNVILKHGDLVKALESCHGMVEGQRYVVESRQGGLVAVTPSGDVPLVDALGTCLDASLDVARCACPLTLPSGQGQATLTDLASSNGLERRGAAVPTSQGGANE